jgi:hypothetical protein
VSGPIPRPSWRERQVSAPHGNDTPLCVFLIVFGCAVIGFLTGAAVILSAVMHAGKNP